MNNLPPIEHIQIQKHKTMSAKEIPVPKSTGFENEQCLFFNLPCTTKSKENKETLINQKSSFNEANIELSQQKNLATKIPSQQMPINSRFTADKHQKGIRLSMGYRRTTVNQKIERQTQNKLVSENESKPTNQVKFLSIQTLGQKDKPYHQLNPLSIDRAKYDAGDVKIGGKKAIPESQISFSASNKMYVSTGLNGTLKNAPNQMFKPQVVFSTPQTALNLSTSYFACNYDYQNQSQYKQRQPFNQNAKFQAIRQNISGNKSLYFSKQHVSQKKNVRYELTIIPIYRCQTETFQHDSNCTKNNESTHYHGHNTTFNEPSYFEQTQEFFNNIQINLHAKRDLQQSTYSNYSQKYRKYMEKQLILPNRTTQKAQINEMSDLMENVRIQTDSVNQEQNQKHQIDLLPKLRTINVSEHRKQRKESYSSSFMVIEGKEKQIESTRKIYLPSNVDTCSIPQSGLINQLDQFLIEDSETNQSIKTEGEVLSVTEISQLNKLQDEVQTLCQTFNHLLADEELLKQESERLCSMKMQELEQDIKELETLKIISEERYQQIEFLRQLIKVKLIQNRFSHSSNLQNKYLKDQKAWERYISYTGDSQFLNESNETTQTQNSNSNLNCQNDQL